MEVGRDHTVIDITSTHEQAGRNPGRFRKLRSIITKTWRKIFKKRNPVAVAPPPNATFSPPSSPQPNNVPEVMITASSSSVDQQAGNIVRTIHMNPIMLMIQEQELGKSILTVGVPTAIAILITTRDAINQTLWGHFVLTGLSAGCMAIWNGILLRGKFQTAYVIENTGIVMVLISFNGLVASALPTEFAWVPIVCGVLCVFPFVVAALPQDAVDKNTADHGN